MFDFISKNPELSAFVFGIINFVWAIFLYFNNKKHQKNLESVKHNLNLDLERRKKVFEIKVNQFEKYYKMVDEFGSSYQVDLPKRMQPIFNEYTERFLKAEEEKNVDERRNVIIWFGDQIGRLTREINESYFRLQSETNSLKLIASDELVKIFDELKLAYEESFNLSNEYMSKFTEIILSHNPELSNKYQKLLSQQAKKLKEKSDMLMNQMRKELNKI